MNQMYTTNIHNVSDEINQTYYLSGYSQKIYEMDLTYVMIIQLVNDKVEKFTIKIIVKIKLIEKLNNKKNVKELIIKDY